ncbi:MAG: hypothetical protein FWH17_01850 [Oscillospiraceae bacterium]|nr:hypothetical protein [Oscillospiraceae bacterium]
MKKMITIAMAALLITALLTACEFNYHPSGSTVVSGVVQTPETTPEDEQPTNPSGAANLKIEGTILTEAEDDGRINIDYVLLSGFDDTTLQDAINEEIYTFFMWPAVSTENEGKNITVTARYGIIGGKHVSLRAYDLIYEDGGAYPENDFRAIMLDLETGENVRWVTDFINIETIEQGGMPVEYKNIGGLLTDGNFVQVYPETSFDGAIEMFADRLAEEVYSLEFYLTETSAGLCVTGLPHAVGGYLIFEADYGGIRPLLTQKLLSVLE